MKVKTIERFTDLKEDKVRELNDEFEVTKTRYEQLNKLGLVEAVQEKKSSKKKKGD